MPPLPSSPTSCSLHCASGDRLGVAGLRGSFCGCNDLQMFESELYNSLTPVLTFAQRSVRIYLRYILPCALTGVSVNVHT